MSNIDQRIVQMVFDNEQFERGTKTTLSTLEKLRQKLNFSESVKNISELESAGRRFSLSSMGQSVDVIANRFTTLGIIGVTALQNITNSAVNAGKALVAAFTIDPVKTGFAEYETQINAVQTILANTSHAGTTLSQVNDALDELNHYADLTIYNFTEMTRNIGTFTAAGVDLDTSVSAIKGIANLAAVSGSTSQQASTAMYQLSQALAAGTVKLQDWNSVVNAGMGGKVFQDALVETARVHGVAIDQMIADAGSFRETLQKGWLTSEVLTETLSKFTGDLTKEQILSMGYTEQQAEAILKMGVTANDAATKVKTFTQLMDTLKEAAQSGWTQSWEIIIGDFEEAKELLTEISDGFSNMINASSNARNEVLQGWKDLGGRTALIESFRNALNGIASVVSPIREAFKEVFPPVTAQQLFNMTKSLEELSKHLILSEANSKLLKDTFKGLFTIVKVGIDLITTFVKGLITIVSNLAPVGSVLLSVTGALGEFISGLDVFSTSSESKIKPFEALGQVIKTVFSNIASVIGTIAPYFYQVGNAIADALGYIQTMIEETISKITVDKVATVVNTGLFAVLALSARKFLSSVTSVFDESEDRFELLKNFFNRIVESFGSGAEEASGLIDNVKELLDGVKGSLEAWQTSLKAEALMKIAAAIGILSVSLIGLSTIDPEKMISSLGGLTVIFTELFAALIAFEKVSKGFGIIQLTKVSAAMIAMSSAILILTGAMKVLASMDWDGVSKGLIGVGGLLLELVVASKVLSTVTNRTKASAVVMIGLAAAIRILVSSVAILGNLDTSSLVKGITGVAAILTELLIFEKINTNYKGMISTALALNLLGSAMLIFSASITRIGALPISEIGKGLLGMAGALAAVTIAMNYLPPNMITTGVGLVAVSAALLGISNAVASLGSMSWTNLAISLSALAGSLAILVVALKAMTTALPGAAALTVVSVSMIALASALKILGSMSVPQLAIALGALAGSFAILGVAGIALGPLVPVLLGLSGTIALLGIGMAAAGAGIAAFATGMATLAAAIALNGAGIAATVTALISLIPTIISKVGEGFISLLTIIGQSGKAIIDAAYTIITSVLKAVTDALPMIVDSGMKIILGILQGIEQNIGKITDIAITIIVTFINTVSSRLPDIVDTAFNLMITFINTLSNTIEQQAPVLFQAMGRLAVAMIDGLVKGLYAGVSEVVHGVKQLGISAIEGLKDVLGIHSPSTEFFELGEYSTEGYALGLQNGIGYVSDSMKEVLGEVVGTLNEYYTKFQDSGIFLGDGFFTGLTDGINKLNQISGNVTDVSEESGTESGEALTSGFETGVNSTKAVATNSVNDMMSGAIESLQGFKSKFELTGIEVADGFWDGFNSSMEKLNSLSTDIGGLSSSMVESGESSLEGLASGITNTIPTAVSSTVDMNDQILASLDARNVDYTEAGKNLVDAFVKGIRNSASIAVAAATVVANDCKQAMHRQYNDFYLTGLALVQGFANGISDNTYIAEARARAMAAAAYEAAMEELDAHSPSRLFMKVGSYVATGFAIGIDENTGDVEDASKNMVSRVVNFATDAAQKITEIITNDGLSPVITPVLDLTKIQNGSNTISNLFTRRQAAAISNFQSEKIPGGDFQKTNPNQGTSYQFIQNNYSPKALSRLDIYRQTKNQFSSLKELTS